MPIAVNDQGQAQFFDGQQWRPAPTAKNEAGDELAFDGGAWVPLQSDFSRSLGQDKTTRAKAALADLGAGRAAALGVGQGATGNFFDELSGLQAAGGGKGAGRLGSPLAATAIGGARLVRDYLTGANDPTLGSLVTGEQPRGAATSTYEAERDRVRTDTKTAREQYPGTMLAGEIGGGLALPVSRVAQAATMPGRIAGGAITGGAYGALAGAGEGESATGRAIGAATGGALGSVIGGGLVPVVAGAAQAARYITRPFRRAVTSSINPDAEAASRIARAIERDAASDPQAGTRLSRAEFDAARAEGQPVTVMDMGGDATRSLADSAAITSPEGRTALNRTINDRYTEQGPRLSSWLRSAFHYPNVQAQQEAIEETARTVNRGAYARAYRDGDQQIWSPEMERLTSSPDVVAAMREAANKGKSRAVTEGMGGFNPGVTVDNGGIVTFQRGNTGQPTYPNLQFWDYTKRALDDAASAARRAGRNDEGSTIERLSRGLRGELDNIVPSYRDARAGAASFFGAENALEAGQNFVGAAKRYGIPEARRALERMNAQERQLFQDGYVSRFIDKIEATGDRRNVLNQFARSPAERAELQLALGRPRAQELEARLRVEGIMDLPRQVVQGNSKTAERLFQLGLAGGILETGHGGINQDPTQMSIGLMIGALSAGGRHVNQRVARRVAEMLASNDPDVIARGIQTVARNQQWMNALRSFDQRIAATGGEQASRTQRNDK